MPSPQLPPLLREVEADPSLLLRAEYAALSSWISRMEAAKRELISRSPLVTRIYTPRSTGSSNNSKPVSYSTPSLNGPTTLSPPKSVHRMTREAYSLSSEPLSGSSMPSPLSPPKSVRRMNRARNSDGTEPIDTPSLPGSPPKSCGSKMRRPHSVLAHGSFSGLDEDWYTNPTPELNSPPKSVRCLRYAIASDDEEDSLPASSMAHRSPEKAAAPVVPASPAPRATPSRCLRLTPARLARAAKLPRSPAVANLITSDVVAQAMPLSQSPGPQAHGRHPILILSGGGENLNPQTPSPQHLVTRGAQKSRNGQGSPEGRLVKDAPVLSLSSFPKTFQSGSGAEQLRMLHGALHQASRPQSIKELIDVLPKDKFDTKRLELLLDVMRSRKLANCTSGLWTVAS